MVEAVIRVRINEGGEKIYGGKKLGREIYWGTKVTTEVKRPMSFTLAEMMRNNALSSKKLIIEEIKQSMERWKRRFFAGLITLH